MVAAQPSIARVHRAGTSSVIGYGVIASRLESTVSNTRRKKRGKPGDSDQPLRGKSKSEWIRGSVKHLKKHGQLKKLPKLRTSTCYLTGKVRFEDEDSALKALVDAVTIRTSKGYARIESRAYYCQYCSGWHLTSQRDTSTVNTEAVDLASHHPSAFKHGLKFLKDGDAREARKHIQHFMLAMQRNSVPDEIWADPWLWAAVNELREAGAPSWLEMRDFPEDLAKAASLDSARAKPDSAWLASYHHLSKSGRAAMMEREDVPLAVIAAFQAALSKLEESKPVDDADTVGDAIVSGHASSDSVGDLDSSEDCRSGDASSGAAGSEDTLTD